MPDGKYRVKVRFPWLHHEEQDGPAADAPEADAGHEAPVSPQAPGDLTDHDDQAHGVMFNPKEFSVDQSVPWQKAVDGGGMNQVAVDDSPGHEAPVDPHGSGDLAIANDGQHGVQFNPKEFTLDQDVPWQKAEAEGANETLTVDGGHAEGALPEHDDEVLVGFEHGDVNQPVVAGGLWNDEGEAPPTSAGGDADLRIRVGSAPPITDHEPDQPIVLGQVPNHDDPSTLVHLDVSEHLTPLDAHEAHDAVDSDDLHEAGHHLGDHLRDLHD